MNERRYSRNGEWVSFDGHLWRVGLAASAVEELGEVTFVELPSLERSVTAGTAVCSIEAVKAAADFYSPVDGRVSAVNTRLGLEPGLVNLSPELEGWIFALEDVSASSLEVLLDERAWLEWETGR